MCMYIQLIALFGNTGFSECTAWFLHGGWSCVQTCAYVFVETVDYSLSLIQPQVPSAKLGLGSLYKLHREVNSPQGDPSACLRAR